MHNDNNIIIILSLIRCQFNIINFFNFLLIFGSHPTMLTSGSLLRYHYWWFYKETIWNGGDQIQVSSMNGKHPSCSNIIKDLWIPAFLHEAAEKDPSKHNLLRAHQQGRLSTPEKCGARGMQPLHFTSQLHASSSQP